MREYANKPESQSRTLDSNPRTSRQAPIADILQTYKNETLGRQPMQRESMVDDELLQAKTSEQASAGAILQQHKENIQRFAPEEDEELIQGKFDTAQREEIDEDELLQGKFESTSTTEQVPVQREKKPNNTGLPDNLKSGIENLSGFSMDDVKVHYNSDKPAQLQALAYAQGTDIHVAPGQEQHLPHEAWHVIQQKQGRVQHTMQMQGVNVNDNEWLEKEADDFSNTIIQRKFDDIDIQSIQQSSATNPFLTAIMQRLMPLYENYSPNMRYLQGQHGGGEAGLENNRPVIRIDPASRAPLGQRGLIGINQLTLQDVLRQKNIFHELTHIEMARVNTNGNFNINNFDVGYEPNEDVVDDIINLFELIGQLPPQIIPNIPELNLVEFLQERVLYMTADDNNREVPTVANELLYMLHTLPNINGQVGNWDQIQNNNIYQNIINSLQHISNRSFMHTIGNAQPMGQPGIIRRFGNWFKNLFNND